MSQVDITCAKCGATPPSLQRFACARCGTATPEGEANYQRETERYKVTRATKPEVSRSDRTVRDKRLKLQIKRAMEAAKAELQPLQPASAIRAAVGLALGSCAAVQVDRLNCSMRLRRTRGGAWICHGRRYRTKRLAEQAWVRDRPPGRATGQRTVTEVMLETVAQALPVVASLALASRKVFEKPEPLLCGQPGESTLPNAPDRCGPDPCGLPPRMRLSEHQRDLLDIWALADGERVFITEAGAQLVLRLGQHPRNCPHCRGLPLPQLLEWFTPEVT